MSWQPPRRPPSEEEIQRRRMFAFAALGAGFLLFLIAIVLAFAGSGGDDGGVPAAQSQTTSPAKRKPARPKPAPAARGFTPVPATAPGAHKAPDEDVPILVYNVIRAPEADTSNPETWVPPDELAAEMDYLAAQGYHPVTLRQVWAAWKEGGLLPSKPIVISFDTGYHSVLANALPILKGHGWPGTLFLQASQTQSDFPASEVKQLIAAGWELDTQGQTGADLTDLSDEELDTEMTGARQGLQREFGVKVEFLSYPGGNFDDRVAEAAQAAGFLGAATLEEGLASKDEPFQLKRIPVENGDGESGLADKLQSAGSG